MGIYMKMRFFQATFAKSQQEKILKNAAAQADSLKSGSAPHLLHSLADKLGQGKMEQPCTFIGRHADSFPFQQRANQIRRCQPKYIGFFP